jgi:hypothetical protein
MVCVCVFVVVVEEEEVRRKFNNYPFPSLLSSATNNSYSVAAYRSQSVSCERKI